MLHTNCYKVGTSQGVFVLHNRKLQYNHNLRKICSNNKRVDIKYFYQIKAIFVKKN